MRHGHTGRPPLTEVVREPDHLAVVMTVLMAVKPTVICCCIVFTVVTAP